MQSTCNARNPRLRTAAPRCGALRPGAALFGAQGWCPSAGVADGECVRLWALRGERPSTVSSSDSSRSKMARWPPMEKSSSFVSCDRGSTPSAQALPRVLRATACVCGCGAASSRTTMLMPSWSRSAWPTAAPSSPYAFWRRSPRSYSDSSCWLASSADRIASRCICTFAAGS
eukprot:411785-Prymnesium_polylepis.1